MKLFHIYTTADYDAKLYLADNKLEDEAPVNPQTTGILGRYLHKVQCMVQRGRRIEAIREHHAVQQRTLIENMTYASQKAELQKSFCHLDRNWNYDCFGRIDELSLALAGRVLVTTWVTMTLVGTFLACVALYTNGWAVRWEGAGEPVVTWFLTTAIATSLYLALDTEPLVLGGRRTNKVEDEEGVTAGVARNRSLPRPMRPGIKVVPWLFGYKMFIPFFAYAIPLGLAVSIRAALTAVAVAVLISVVVAELMCFILAGCFDCDYAGHFAVLYVTTRPGGWEKVGQIDCELRAVDNEISTN